MDEDNNPRAMVTTRSATPSLSDLAISTRLWSLLSSNAPGELEVEEIAGDPVLHQEAQFVAKRLAEVCRGCGEDAVRRALQGLVLTFGVGEAARAAAFWAPYMATLRDVPADALRAAVAEYVAAPTSEFFPKPGPLRALADKHAAPILRAASRAARAAKAHPKRHGDERTLEQREAVQRMLADFRGQVAARAAARPRPPEPPPVQGRVDERGLTEAMRATLARARAD